MRILFLTQWFEPEPGAIRGLPLARWLKQRGHDLKVLTGFPNYPGGKLYPGYRMRWRQWETMEGVPVLRVPLYPSHSRSAVGRVANYTSFAFSAATLGCALAGSADVAYVYHPPATVGFPAVLLKLVRRIPFVYHIADMWPESVVESGMLGQGMSKRLAEAILGRWCRIVYRRADAITVLSPGFQRLLVERGVPAQKVSVVYNWTDEGAFRPVPRDPALAQQLGMAGRFNVVYAGNLGAFQGLDAVIRAAVLLKDVPQVQIVLTGTGQQEAELKQLGSRLQADNVRFLGGQPYRDMPAIHSLADVLLVHLKDLPFFTTTIPSKTQVALASGRPVLMAVRGDAADLVRRAQAGLTCEPANEQALAAAVRAFYAMDPAAREALGRNGRDFYLREMALVVGGRMTESVLEAVAGKRTASGAAEPAELRTVPRDAGR